MRDDVKQKRQKKKNQPWYSQEVVVATEELAVTREALVRQLAFALAARHTLRVPGLVRHVEQVTVQDRLIASRAPDQLHVPVDVRERRRLLRDPLMRSRTARLQR